MIPEYPHPTFDFHELRYGTTERVPRSLVHPAAREISRVITASHEFGHSLQVDGTSFGLFADLTNVTNGTAYFFLCSSAPLGGGIISANKFLFEGVLACELATAPEAWRPIMRYYLKTAAQAPPLVTFSAPGPMPHILPWLNGFCTPEVTRLSSEEKCSLIATVKVVGIALLARCEQGIRNSVASGRQFLPDPGEYPELLLDSEE